MKWIGISGSWQYQSAELNKDLLSDVDEIIANGDGIVSGGALGVDYLATQRMITGMVDWSKRVKIIIPTSFEIYRNHYFKRADEGVITVEQAKQLIEQLEKVKAAGCLIEMDFVDRPHKDTYYARNTEVVKACDELWAYQINGSNGTQNTVNTALEMGKPVKLKKYKV